MDEKMTELLYPAAFAWAILHIAAAFHNFVHGIDKGYGHSYGWAGYALAVSCLLVLLLVHVLVLYGRKRSAARILGRYWAVTLLIFVFFAVVGAVSDHLLLAGLAILITPCLPLAPLMELIPVPAAISGALLALLCGLFCLWVYQKK